MIVKLNQSKHGWRHLAGKNTEDTQDIIYSVWSIPF